MSRLCGKLEETPTLPPCPPGPSSPDSFDRRSPQQLSKQAIKATWIDLFSAMDFRERSIFRMYVRSTKPIEGRGKNQAVIQK
jgi:hypothetical protein